MILERQLQAVSRIQRALSSRGFFGTVTLRFEAGHLTYARIEEIVKLEEVDRWVEGAGFLEDARLPAAPPTPPLPRSPTPDSRGA